MARKNTSRAETSSSAIHFDASTKTVMAEATQENIKEKVLAVREVVPGKSNNEVILVLQYYDYCVERTIQAYLEDGAKEALQEWNFTGKQQPNKKRKNKKKAGGSAGAGASNEKANVSASTPSSTEAILQPPTSAASDVVVAAAVNGKSSLPNGDLSHESEDGMATAASPTGAVPLPQRSPHKARGHTEKNHHRHQQQQHHHHHHNNQEARERTTSEVSTGSGVGDHKRPFQGIEKAIKDLHRQTTSLERLRYLLDQEIDRSYRSVKSVFEELRQGLSTREAELYKEMDQLKQEASEMLDSRKSKAVDLKQQLDRAERLSEAEVSGLRQEVKHFVSERRHDEELGRTTRFLYDSDHLLAEISKFGEVVHVKSASSARRASASSIASSLVSLDGTSGAQDLDSLSNSQEVTELQDRLKNSLKLQSAVTSLENGNTKDYIPPKNGRRRPGNKSNTGNEGRPATGKNYSGASGVHSDRHSSPTPNEPSGVQGTSRGDGSSNSNRSAPYQATGSPGRGGGARRGAGGGRGRGGARPPFGSGRGGRVAAGDAGTQPSTAGSALPVNI